MQPLYVTWYLFTSNLFCVCSFIVCVVRHMSPGGVLASSAKQQNKKNLVWTLIMCEIYYMISFSFTKRPPECVNVKNASLAFQRVRNKWSFSKLTYSPRPSEGRGLCGSKAGKRLVASNVLSFLWMPDLHVSVDELPTSCCGVLTYGGQWEPHWRSHRASCPQSAVLLRREQNRCSLMWADWLTGTLNNLLTHIDFNFTLVHQSKLHLHEPIFHSTCCLKTCCHQSVSAVGKMKMVLVSYHLLMEKSISDA